MKPYRLLSAKEAFEKNYFIDSHIVIEGPNGFYCDPNDYEELMYELNRVHAEVEYEKNRVKELEERIEDIGWDAWERDLYD